MEDDELGKGKTTAGLSARPLATRVARDSCTPPGSDEEMTQLSNRRAYFSSTNPNPNDIRIGWLPPLKD